MKTITICVMKMITLCLAAFLVLSACEGQNKKPTTAPLPPATPASDSINQAAPDNTHRDTASYDRMSGRGYDSIPKQ